MSYIGKFRCGTCPSRFRAFEIAPDEVRICHKCGNNVPVDQRSLIPLYHYQCIGSTCSQSWKGKIGIDGNPKDYRCNRCGERGQIIGRWDPAIRQQQKEEKNDRVELAFGHSDDEFVWDSDEEDVMEMYETFMLVNGGQDDVTPLAEAELGAASVDLKVECCVCHEQHPIMEMADFGCHTNTCNDCAKTYLETQITEGNITRLLCPVPDCQKEIDQKTVHQIVSLASFERLVTLQLKSTGLPEIATCPNPECGQLIQVLPEYGYCKSCDYKFCTNCNQAYHGTIQCHMNPEELRTQIRRSLVTDQAEARQVNQRRAQIDASEDLISRVCKKCPTCGAKIEKIEGCNTMNCSRCNTAFCWNCRYKLNTLDGADPHQDPHFRNGECLLFDVDDEYLGGGEEDDDDDD